MLRRWRIFFCQSIVAKDKRLPIIKRTGKTIENFVPQGWHLLDSCTGHLNEDVLQDYAMIIEQDEQMLDTSAKEPIMPRRILLVILGTGVGKTMMIATQHNTFILPKQMAQIDDEPLSDFEITNNNTLQIGFRLSASEGSWVVTHTVYTFGYKNEELVLLAATDNNFNRDTHDSEERQFDFAKSKVHITNIVADDERHAKRKTYKLHQKKYKRIQDLEKPYMWRIDDWFL